MIRNWAAGLVWSSIIVAFGLGGCGERQTQTTSTTASVTSPQPVVAPGTPITFATVCALCHGTRGEGNLALRTPSIAGLPEWYVRLQLTKFRTHLRGTDPRDADGQRMHVIANQLSADDVASLASTIAAMERHPTRNTLGGDPQRGRDLYEERCMPCHRYTGSGELAFNSAPLTGLQDWYLAAQLEKFRAGVRGRNVNDEDGAKMHLITSDLTDTQIRDVVAHIAWLADKYR